MKLAGVDRGDIIIFEYRDVDECAVCKVIDPEISYHPAAEKPCIKADMFDDSSKIYALERSGYVITESIMKVLL